MRLADVDVRDLSSVEITAGLGGFLVLFALGLAVWFLGRDLSRRLRGMRQRESLRAEAQSDKTKNAGAQTTDRQRETAPVEDSARGANETGSDADRSGAVDGE